jgi:hypothetical protein
MNPARATEQDDQHCQWFFPRTIQEKRSILVRNETQTRREADRRCAVLLPLALAVVSFGNCADIASSSFQLTFGIFFS